MAKKVFHLLFSIFLTYLSVKIFYQLYNSNISYLNDLQSILYAIFLNLYLLGAFAFVGFSFPTYKFLPQSYYTIKNPTALIKVYKLFGVKYYRYLLMLFIWGKEKNRKRYFGGSRNDLEHLDIESRRSEFGHLMALVLLFLLSIPFIFKGYILLFLLTNLISFIVNFSPVILQRHHRIRIERIKNS